MTNAEDRARKHVERCDRLFDQIPGDKEFAYHQMRLLALELLGDLTAARTALARLLARVEDAETDAANARTARDEAMDRSSARDYERSTSRGADPDAR